MCGAETVSINIVYEQLRAGGGGAAPGRPGRWSKQNREALSPTPWADSAVSHTCSHTHSGLNREPASRRALKHTSPAHCVSTHTCGSSRGARTLTVAPTLCHTVTAHVMGTQAAAPSQSSTTPGSGRATRRDAETQRPAGLHSAPPLPEPAPSPPSTFAAQPGRAADRAGLAGRGSGPVPQGWASFRTEHASVTSSEAHGGAQC